MKNHDGTVFIESVPDHGATATLVLPLG